MACPTYYKEKKNLFIDKLKNDEVWKYVKYCRGIIVYFYISLILCIINPIITSIEIKLAYKDYIKFGWIPLSVIIITTIAFVIPLSISDYDVQTFLPRFHYDLYQNFVASGCDDNFNLTEDKDKLEDINRKILAAYIPTLISMYIVLIIVIYIFRKSIREILREIWYSW